jgi:ABC-type antimicrobial peptide transport system ATPase subunit
MSARPTDAEVLRDDEKFALKAAESRERLKMTYQDDETALLLRDRLVEAREVLREIGEMDSVDDCGSDCSGCREKIKLAKNACKEG